MAVFFLAFFTIANVILMNTIVGILVETYLYQKEKNGNIFFFIIIYFTYKKIISKDPAFKYSDHQKEWSKIKEFIYKMNPKAIRPSPKSKFRLEVCTIVKSRFFTNFILFSTLLNTILLMLYWHRQPDSMKTSLGNKQTFLF